MLGEGEVPVWEYTLDMEVVLLGLEESTLILWSAQ